MGTFFLSGNPFFAAKFDLTGQLLWFQSLHITGVFQCFPINADIVISQARTGVYILGNWLTQLTFPSAALNGAGGWIVAKLSANDGHYVGHGATTISSSALLWQFLVIMHFLASLTQLSDPRGSSQQTQVSTLDEATGNTVATITANIPGVATTALAFDCSHAGFVFLYASGSYSQPMVFGQNLAFPSGCFLMQLLVSGPGSGGGGVLPNTDTTALPTQQCNVVNQIDMDGAGRVIMVGQSGGADLFIAEADIFDFP